IQRGSQARRAAANDQDVVHGDAPFVDECGVMVFGFLKSRKGQIAGPRFGFCGTWRNKFVRFSTLGF
ncbi:MAG: hypothetical protein K5990_00940, partial [Oscillospiraceae bacterium]|nr:hypothetical protein [Oscillospiraceae bacterium]